MSYELTTLGNGLRVATEKLSGVETVSIAISVDVGARHESLAQHGVSHLLEHMAFKGTSTRSAQDIAVAFDAIGGSVNAYTSLEHTVYYAKVLKEDLPIATDILCDILLRSTFDESELDKERQVVVQELAMHQDTPDDLVFDYFQDAAYPNQPLGRSILGTEASLNRHTSADMQHYIDRHYQPKRMALSVAGNLDHDHVVTLAERFFDKQLGDEPFTYEPAHYVGGERLIEKQLEQIQFSLGFESVTMHHPDYYASLILSSAMGGGMASRLFQEIRENRGLVYTINSFVSPYEDTGMFGVYAATGAEEIGEMVPALLDELKRAADDLTQEEINRARQQQKAALLMQRESTSSMAEWIGRHLLIYGRYMDAKEVAEKFDAVTREQVLSVAQRVLETKVPTLTALGPVAGMEGLDGITKRLAA